MCTLEHYIRAEEAERTRWHKPTSNVAQGFQGRQPDDVPVTMASFLSPNLALFSAAFFIPCREGILKPASCSKAVALPTRQADARTKRLKRGMTATV